MKYFVLVVCLVGIFPVTATAQTYSWTGASSGLWSTAGNWTGGTPVSGIDTILNFNNAVNLTTTQDITTSPTPLILTQINFGSSAGQFIINGAPLDFRNDSSSNGPVLRNDTNTFMRYNNDIVFTDTVTLRNANNTLGRHDFYGTITGNGGVTIRSGGMAVFGTANYQGNTLVNNLDGGYSNIFIASGGVFNSPGTITFNTGHYAYLQVDGTINAGGLLTLGGVPNNGNEANRTQLFGSGTINRDVLLRSTPVYTQGLTINGNLTVSDYSSFIGLSSFSTTLNVNGNTTFNQSFEMRNTSTLNVSGTTTVNNGTFTIPSTATFGGTGTSLVLNSPNGTTTTLLLGTSITRDVTTSQSGNGGVTISNANQSAAGTINGSITSTNGLTISGGNNSLTVTGPITTSGSGSLAIQGVVTVNGLTTINSGISLLIGNSIFNGPGAITVNAGGSISVTTQTLPKTITSAGTLSAFNGGTYSGPVTTLAGATLVGTSNTTMTISNTLTVSGDTTIRQAGSDGPVTVTGLTTINGGRIIVQPGATFNPTGGLTVASGASFTANGTTNGTTVTVLNNGSITGSGTINGTVTNAVTIQPGGKLAPGNSPGQIVIGGGLDVGGILEIEISSGGGNNSNTTGNTTPGQGFDTVQVTPPPSNNVPTKAVVRTGTSAVRVRTANTNQTAFNGDTFWGTTKRWQVMSTTNGGIELRDENNVLLGNFYTANAELYDPSGTTLFNPYSQYPHSSFSYEILANGNGALLNLVWSPVPEPATVLAVASIGLLGVYRLRRRRVAVVAQDLSHAV
jgi:PEP-CTERM motif